MPAKHPAITNIESRMLALQIDVKTGEKKLKMASISEEAAFGYVSDKVEDNSFKIH
jgi:hypothetical protein